MSTDTVEEIAFTLRQNGRAHMDFLADLGKTTMHVQKDLATGLAASGVSNETLPDDLDERIRFAEPKLRALKAGRVAGLIGEYSGDQHGKAAINAFEEIREELEPRLKNIGSNGPCTLERNEDLDVPQYWDNVAIHRTTGGWEGHEYQGFIHAELVHRFYVAKNFGGDIFAQRASVLKHLPEDFAPKRIAEFGASSGYFTRAIQSVYPDSEIWGCDLSLRFLEHAQRIANLNGWAWKLFRRPAQDTQWPDAHFDLACSYILLHEITNEATRGIFGEAYRVTRPGGWMLMSDVTPYSAQDKMAVWKNDRGTVRAGEPYWREAATLDLKALAEEVGFEDVRSFGMNGDFQYPWVTMGRKPA